jgi:hypothetical protein
MRVTLGYARPLLAKYAFNGACIGDPRIDPRINEARERLMKKRRKWKGMVQRYVFCTSDNCITLPREILTIEGANLCRVPFNIRNHWYEVLEGGPGKVDSKTCAYRSFVDRGDGFVTFVDLCAARFVKVYADVPEGGTAKILLQGFDENGNRVRTPDASSTDGWVDGEWISINSSSPAASTTRFTSLDGVQKPVTNGFIRLYAVNPDDSTQLAISILHPSDVAPSYRRYFISNLNNANGQSRQMIVLAVMRYLPVTKDTDFLIIENIGALKHMMLALQAEEQGQEQKAVFHEGKAEDILQQELDQYMGDAATGSMPVQVDSYSASMSEIPSIL